MKAVQCFILPALVAGVLLGEQKANAANTTSFPKNKIRKPVHGTRMEVWRADLKQEYNSTIALARQIPDTRITKSIVYFSYWKGKLNQKHLWSIKSCYLTNVLNHAGQRRIVLYVDTSVDGPREIIEEIRLYATITILNFKAESVGTPFEYDTTEHQGPGIAPLKFLANKIRLMLLYKYGGLWFDLDVLFLRSLDPLYVKFPRIFVYAWEHEPYPNNAIVYVPEARMEDMATLIKWFQLHGQSYCFQMTKCTFDKPLPVLVLPCSWFDPFWLPSAPRDGLNSFPDFLTKSTRSYTLKNFYPGAFTYHWHNSWASPIEKHSAFDQITQDLLRRFPLTRPQKKKYSALLGGNVNDTASR